jgi:ribonuclease BN (tRNA processing enzyme)
MLCTQHLRNLFLGLCLALFAVSAAQADGFDRGKGKKRLAVDRVASNGLSIMVLGSGAPAAQPNGRASAGYMIFLDGKPKVLMDVGGGVYQRIADSGMNINPLEIVLLSHLHVDHVGDVDPIVKALFFHNRLAGFPRDPDMTLHFFGPDKAPDGAPAPALRFPTTERFIHAHFDGTDGVEAYLNDFSQVIGQIPFNYDTVSVEHDNSLGVRTIYEKDGLVIKAIGVPHGPAPALAFRVEYKGKSIAYSGDTTSLSANGNMIEISRDADLLIYDTAIMDDTGLPFSAVHTTPTRIGEVARDANAKRLVLSHITPITEPNLGQVKQLIRDAGYYGKIGVAKDLRVYNMHVDRYPKGDDDDDDD